MPSWTTPDSDTPRSHRGPDVHLGRCDAVTCLCSVGKDMLLFHMYMTNKNTMVIL